MQKEVQVDDFFLFNIMHLKISTNLMVTIELYDLIWSSNEELMFW